MHCYGVTIINRPSRAIANLLCYAAGLFEHSPLRSRLSTGVGGAGRSDDVPLLVLVFDEMV
jgi:hypothetical protein